MAPVPDPLPLPLQLFLHLRHSRPALDHGAFQNLILIIDRFHSALVVAHLRLHVGDLALQVPGLPSAGPSPACEPRGEDKESVSAGFTLKC